MNKAVKNIEQRTLEQRIDFVEQRNIRVEQDKAWETSWTRRISIGILTYLVILAYLTVIHNQNPYINAIVPAIGFVLSTLVLKRIRDFWQK